MVTFFRCVFSGALMLAWLCAGGQTVAQTSVINGASAPELALTASQKQIIYQSISATRKNHAAPLGFRAAVGADVPETIELKPIPDTIAGLIPATKDLETAMVERQVMLVDPKAKRVVAVITHAP